MSSSCKGSDDTVFEGRGGTGIVADIEVGVYRFYVDRCEFVGVYEDAAIAALKGQFVGHCYHSIVFSKGPQTFFGNFLG